MPARGISNFADSDMEDTSNFHDENSAISIAKPSASPEPVKKKGGRPKANPNRVTKPKATAVRKADVENGGTAKRARKPTASKRKALEEQINGKNPDAEVDHATKPSVAHNTDTPMSDAVISDDELESPRTLAQGKQTGASKVKPSANSRAVSKPKTTTQKRAKQAEPDKVSSFEQSRKRQTDYRRTMKMKSFEIPFPSHSMKTTTILIPIHLQSGDHCSSRALQLVDFSVQHETSLRSDIGLVVHLIQTVMEAILN